MLDEPHSLSFSDTLDLSSLIGHGYRYPPIVAPTCEDDRCIRPLLGMFLPSTDGLRLLGGLSHDSGRCFGALCDRALALEDSVLAM